jgi:D-alanyl-D-alanine carboxypeptidase
MPLRIVAWTFAAAVLFAAPLQAGPYLLADVKTGQVIAESEAGRPWYPASVTKLMTTYLAFQAMRERKVEPLTLLKVSANAMAQPPSKMGFKAGTEVTLDNAIKMLMVRSANDIAVVVAEGVAGDVDTFVAEMNRTAQRLGMTGTHFMNPHGLPDPEQVTTARDMAILGRALIQEFPEYELYFRIPAIQLGQRIIRNHNRLIDRYPGADGMKTGFICSSGFNVVAGAHRGGRRLIAVVFGSYSATQRAEDAARLFERGFRPGAMPNEVGTLEQIRNMHGTPHDMRDDMCNPKRRRPAAESDIDEDDDADEAAATDSKGKQTKAKQQRQSLLTDLTASMPPIRVFTGPPGKVPEEGLVARDGKASPAKKEAAVKPAKPEAAKAASPVKDQAKSAVKPAQASTAAKPKEPQKQVQPKQ